MKAVQVVARGKAEFVNVPKPEVSPGRNTHSNGLSFAVRK